MKITELLIERFGVWDDYRVPVNEDGLTIIYGENETGKSTLLNFIRALFYGQDLPQRRDGAEGRVRFSWKDRSYELHRSWRTESPLDGERFQGEIKNGPGRLILHGIETEDSAEAQLNDLLFGISPELFERAFLLNQKDMQELAALDRQAVGDRIFNVALGPEAQRLLFALNAMDAERMRLLGRPDIELTLQDDVSPVDDDHPTVEQPGGVGLLPRLLKRRAEIDEQLEATREQREHHAERLRQKQSISQDIQQLKAREQQIQQNLGGYQFLERVYTPWRNVREYRQELAALNHVAEFPKDGVLQMQELDQEIESNRKCRELLQSEQDQTTRQLASLDFDAELEIHAATMQSWIDQRDWLLELQNKAHDAEAESISLLDEFQARQEKLFRGGTQSNWEEIDTSPTAYEEFLSLATDYRSALSRRSRIRRQRKNKEDELHTLEQEFVKKCDLLQGRSIHSAIDETRQTLVELEELGQYRMREQEQEQHLKNLKVEIEQLEQRTILPRWVQGVLTFFAISGIVLMIVGLITGVRTNAIAGAIYGLLGISCGGLTWYLKSHFDIDISARVGELREEYRDTEIALRELRHLVTRLLAKVPPSVQADLKRDSARWHSNQPANVRSRPGLQSAAPIMDSEAVRNVLHQLTQLQQLSGEATQVEQLRENCSELRRKHRKTQRKLSDVRQAWCERLRELGMQETVRIGDAFGEWQRLAEVRESYQQYVEAHTRAEEYRDIIHGAGRRIIRVAQKMDDNIPDDADGLQILGEWECKLENYSRSQTDRLRLKQDQEKRQREIADYDELLLDLESRQRALFVQAGAGNRSEFELRVEQHQRRQELVQLLEMAELELSEVAETEPELAIMEEDMEAFDDEHNSTAIAEQRLELETLQELLGEQREQLGGVVQEMNSIEKDQRSSELRLQRAELTTQIQTAVKNWAAWQQASHALSQIRNRMERTNQPATLQSASRLLNPLTKGRYCSVWAPLGERQLRVDNHEGRPCRIEELSGATREQLFLAVRLALVNELRRNRVELPLLLDDVLVSFDQSRTESAVETLMDLAGSGQQVLFFTCHLHLAQMFQHKGIEPIWLPGVQEQLHRLEERRSA